MGEAEIMSDVEDLARLVFKRVGQLAEVLESSDNALRRAFANHLNLVSEATHQIWKTEMVYSVDPSDEADAIRAALGPDADRLELAVLVSDAKQAADALNQAIERAEGGKSEQA